MKSSIKSGNMFSIHLINQSVLYHSDSQSTEIYQVLMHLNSCHNIFPITQIKQVKYSIKKKTTCFISKNTLLTWIIIGEIIFLCLTCFFSVSAIISEHRWINIQSTIFPSLPISSFASDLSMKNLKKLQCR